MKKLHGLLPVFLLSLFFGRCVSVDRIAKSEEILEVVCTEGIENAYPYRSKDGSKLMFQSDRSERHGFLREIRTDSEGHALYLASALRTEEGICLMNL